MFCRNVLAVSMFHNVYEVLQVRGFSEREYTSHPVFLLLLTDHESKTNALYGCNTRQSKFRVLVFWDA